jgi:hypothetical protein
MYRTKDSEITHFSPKTHLLQELRKLQKLGGQKLFYGSLSQEALNLGKICGQLSEQGK